MMGAVRSVEVRPCPAETPDWHHKDAKIEKEAGYG